MRSTITLYAEIIELSSLCNNCLNNLFNLFVSLKDTKKALVVKSEIDRRQREKEGNDVINKILGI